MLKFRGENYLEKRLITEFSGWEFRAALDAFQLVLRVGLNVEKIAIYSDNNWQELASKVDSWFISDEIEAFDSNDLAVQWLTD